MEVHVGDEVGDVEDVDAGSVAGFDMAVAHVFADDAGVFAFNESVVVGAARAGFGLLNEELVEQFGDDGVDEFGAVVGMKAEDTEGEWDLSRILCPKGSTGKEPGWMTATTRPVRSIKRSAVALKEINFRRRRAKKMTARA